MRDYRTNGPKLVLDCRNNLGESLIWDDRRAGLWWVNIHEGEVCFWRPGKDRHDIISINQRIGAIALRANGGLVAALATGFAFLDPETGRLDAIADIEPDLPTTRLNDGRADPFGRFVCGGMDEAKPQQGISAVYSLGADLSVTQVIPAISCANSTCWSPDGRVLYFTDMPSRVIVAYDYDPATGSVSGKRNFVDLGGEPGLADGSTVDIEGYLWNAQWGGRKLVRYAPDGTVDREIAMPISNPTCLTFGGPDLSTLYVTSAWFGLDDAARAAEPEAGGIFAVVPGVRGMLENRFAG